MTVLHEVMQARHELAEQLQPMLVRNARRLHEAETAQVPDPAPIDECVGLASIQRVRRDQGHAFRACAKQLAEAPERDGAAGRSGAEASSQPSGNRSRREASMLLMGLMVAAHKNPAHRCRAHHWPRAGAPGLARPRAGRASRRPLFRGCRRPRRRRASCRRARWRLGDSCRALLRREPLGIAPPAAPAGRLRARVPSRVRPQHRRHPRGGCPGRHHAHAGGQAHRPPAPRARPAASATPCSTAIPASSQSAATSSCRAAWQT